MAQASSITLTRARPRPGRQPGAEIARRVLTVPLVLLACALVLVTLPLTGLAAVASDLVLRSSWARTRCLAMLAVYLCCESVGLLLAFATWLFGGTWIGADPSRFVRWNFRLQVAWGTTLFAAARRIFALRLVEDQGIEPAGRPLLVFIRHASIIDTLLPVSLISARFGIVLRYVLKRELLWDPCLDVVGNRLPNYFTRRGSRTSEQEAEHVGQLMKGLGDQDGVLVFPEGTRYSPAKRRRAISRLCQSGKPELAEQAEQLHHLLPPRLGGPLALLEQNEVADVVFMMHSGFEGAITPRDLLRGELTNRTIRVTAWTVPLEEIPRARDARIDWLYDQWQRGDRWLAEA